MGVVPCNKEHPIVVWEGDYEKKHFNQRTFDRREPALAGGVRGL
jgi:hypothetical protein